MAFLFMNLVYAEVKFITNSNSAADLTDNIRGYVCSYREKVG